MRLYTDNNGKWAGTQAEAKRDLKDWQQHEVPVSKEALLEFLNQYKVSISDQVLDTSSEPSSPPSKISFLDEHNLRSAFEAAALVRGHIRRVFDKLENDLEEGEAK